MYYLTVGDSLFGQVIVDDQSMFTIISKVFTHSTPRIWGQVLQRSSVRGSGRYNNGVVDSTSICQTFQDLGNCGSLLSNSNVDTVQLLLFIISIIESFLIDDSVDGQSSFSEKIKFSQMTIYVNAGILTQFDDHR